MKTDMMNYYLVCEAFKLCNKKSDYITEHIHTKRRTHARTHMHIYIRSFSSFLGSVFVWVYGTLILLGY